MGEAAVGDSSKPVLHRKHFTTAEDSLLKILVLEHGTKDFKKIASFMNGRTARQARERYQNYLAPEINHGPWSRAEDALLQVKFAELGPKWAAIAEFFPGRCDVSVKNRWNSISKAASEPVIGQEPHPPHDDPDDEKSLVDQEFTQSPFESGFIGADLRDWIFP
jgi:hypothetical protein